MLPERLQRLLSDFAPFEDPQERLAALIDRAKKIPPVPPGDRTQLNRVRGCVSVVWLVSEVHEGRCFFHGDAESPMVRGLILLLCQFFSGAPAEEIVATRIDPLDKLGVTANLSPTRQNGLAATRAAILSFAARNVPAKTRPESRP